MGFTGSGTLDFDSKHGTLEYATQEILQTSDVKVLNTLKESNSAFKDVRSTLSSWSGRALRYYDQDTSVHNSILSDLKSLTGVVAGLPGEISSSVSTALVPVKNAQLQLYNQVGAIASEIPKINTSLEAVKTSIQGLSSSLDQINANISNIGSNKPQDTPQVSSVKDFTPDYSDAINDISDIVGSIRDSILGFDGSIDVSSIHPDLHRDLDKIKGVIEDIANKYKTPEGFDLNGFTADVQDLVGNFSEGVVESMVNVMLPEMAEQYADFVENFTNSFSEEMERQNNSLVNALTTQTQSLPDQFDFNGAVVALSGPEVLAIHKQIVDIYELQSQFHTDTITWMENLDGRLNKSFMSLDTTVRRSGSSSGGLADEIDSFDDVSESSKSTGNIVSSIFSLLKESKIGDYLSTIVGMFTFANVAEHLDQIHKDTRDIIRVTGLNRDAAVDLRGDVNKNLFNTFGMGTLSADDRETALQEAIRSGAVSKEHFEQIAETTAVYNKLLGTTVDFSQGWAKSLMVTKTNADEYLEAVAIGIDDFSNAFYVSADVLQKSAERYADTARIFTTDMKSFSKAVNSAVQLQAAQEAAAIQSMDIPEWVDHLSKTFVGNWSDADKARLVALGETDFIGFADRALKDQTAAVQSLLPEFREMTQKAKEDVTAGGSAGQVARGLAENVWGMNAIDLASDAEKLDEFEKVLTAENVTKNGDISAIKDRTVQAANNNHWEEISNIASALRDDQDSIPGKILGWLEKNGVSSMAAGIFAGIASSLLTNIITKLGGKVLGKVLGDVAGKAAGAAAGKAAGSAAGEAGAGILSSLKALALWTPTGEAATLGAGGAMSAGLAATLGTAVVGLGLSIKDAVKGVKDWTSKEDSFGTKLTAGISGFFLGSGKGLADKDATGWDVAKNTGGNALKGAALGAAIGSIIPGAGTAIGAGIGAAAGGILGLIGGGKRLTDATKKDADVTNGDTPTESTIEDKTSEVKPASDVTHTGRRPSFTASEGRKGLSDASGLNSYTFSDYSAQKIVENNTPIEHVPGEGKTKEDFGITDDLSKQVDDITTKGKNPSDQSENALGATATTDLTTENKPVLYGSKEYEEITNKPKTRPEDSIGEQDSTVTKEESDLVSNTTALQDLTTAIQQLYTGITGEVMPNSEDLTENAAIDANTEVPTDSTKDQDKKLSGFADVATKGLSTVLGTGLYGPLGILASKAIKKYRGDEEPEKIGGVKGTVGGALSAIAGSGLYGPLGVLASKVIDKALVVPESNAGGKENSGEIGSSFSNALTDFSNSAVGDISTNLLKSGVFGITGMLAGNAFDLLRNNVNAESPAVKGPIIKDTNTLGADLITSPIVASIDNNMSTLISLMEQLVANNKSDKNTGSSYPKVPPVAPPVTTNDTTITNYHAQSGVMA